jgi:alcohol dehydrogenase, propanol-preferring
MHMHAARPHEYGTPLLIDEAPAPTPGAGQVVIRVAGAGYCHSDPHVISEIPILLYTPITLGPREIPCCDGSHAAIKFADALTEE